jgi:GNAT superfamily N-acetyltransferase
MGTPSTVLALVRARRFDVLLYELRRRVYSRVVYLGVRLDLSELPRVPKAGQGVSLRQIEPDDYPYFTDFCAPGLDVIGVLIRISAGRRLHSRIRTCYVLVTSDGKPCHMEYLVYPDQQRDLEDFFPGRFPRLAPDEALLEYAFTLDEYRGRGTALVAMAELASRAKGDGMRSLVTFAPLDNEPMLKLCEWSGFVPYLERTEEFLLFRQRMTFRNLPSGAGYPSTAGAAAPKGGGRFAG